MTERPRARTREKAPLSRSPLNGIGTTVEIRRSEQDGQGVCEACPPPSLTDLTRAVFRQGDGSIPESSPETVLGARDSDRVRPRLACEDRADGRVVDSGHVLGGADRRVPECISEVEDVPADGLPNRVGERVVGPSGADLARCLSRSSSHGYSVSAQQLDPSVSGTRCYTERSYAHESRGWRMDVAAYHPASLSDRDWSRIRPFVTAVVETA